MAIHERAYTGVYPDNHREFVCDFTSDVDSLPTQQRGRDYCSTSSVAFVIEDSSKWMLNSEGQWVQVYGSGSGSGSEFDIDIATDEEVNSMFEDVFGN